VRAGLRADDLPLVVRVVAVSSNISPDRFRQVLGHLPTGACIVTAVCEDGQLRGMSCNSFTSLSLRPPLTGFAVAASSTTWPLVRQAAGFAVNVLAEDQHALCRRFSRRGIDRFANVAWTLSSRGNPLLAGALAWLDCEIADEHAAGDHTFVHAVVRELAVGESDHPLIFFRGDFGAFRPRASNRIQHHDLHRTRW
jgi:flavin reductase (DIM6/NTAB) family NADH-FMN oxidoreductase RutF